MRLGGVFSNLLSLGGQLISAVNASAVEAEAPSSSPWLWVERESNQMEAKLKQLMELLERIKAALYDAGEREIRDGSRSSGLLPTMPRMSVDEYRFEVGSSGGQKSHRSEE